MSTGLVATTAGAGLACTCPARSQPVAQSNGCLLTAEDALRLSAGAAAAQVIRPAEEVVLRSGDRDFDLALAQSLAKISAVLAVSPGFAFYNDADSPNAFASPNIQLNGADGTVLFGLTLLASLRNAPESPEVGIVAICAHEFAHILQFKHGLVRLVQNGAPGVKRAELQADFFAGYFVGMRRRERPSFPAAVAAMTQYNAGDNQFWSPQHHGTQQERGAAFVRGYEVAYQDHRPLGEAVQISVNYASIL